jgi:hypothetical protein
MKKILIILLILLLSQVCFAGRVQQAHKAVIAANNGAMPPAGSITRLAQTSANDGAGSHGSLTFTHNVPNTGSNRILIVSVGGYVYTSSTPTISGVTYNGDALSLYGSIHTYTSGNNHFYEAFYYLANPDTGSNYNVVITFSESLNDISAGAISYSGVHQTTPFSGALVTGTNSGTTASVNVSSASDELVIDAVWAVEGTGDDIDVGAGQTEIFDITSPDNYNLGGSEETGAATTTMSWTVGNGIWLQVAGSLQAP